MPSLDEGLERLMSFVKFNEPLVWLTLFVTLSFSDFVCTMPAQKSSTVIKIKAKLKAVFTKSDYF
jgi:hypothetical protein